MTSSELARPLPDFHGFGYKIAQIENNTHCNYKCWFCPNAYDTPAPKECMSLDLFKKILTEIRSVYQPWELNDVSFSLTTLGIAKLNWSFTFAIEWMLCSVASLFLIKTF